MGSPVDRIRFQKEDFATTSIDILPGNEAVTEAPVNPVVPVVATGVAATLCLWMCGIRGKRG